jgi:hypothetical protein
MRRIKKNTISQLIAGDVVVVMANLTVISVLVCFVTAQYIRELNT